MKSKYAALEEALRYQMTLYRPHEYGDDDRPYSIPEGTERRPNEAVDSDPYEPTGNPKVDQILARARPRILYGGHPSNNTKKTYEDDDGFIDGDKMTITFPHREQFTKPEQYLPVLLHELVHWTKGKGRAPRKNYGMTLLDRLFGQVSPGYVREELTAEIGATLLLEAVGENPDLAERGDYAGGWLSALPEDEREAAFREATVDAERAVDYLLSFVD